MPNTNPQYTFYKLLLDLFFFGYNATHKKFDLKLAEEVVVLAETHRDTITLPDLTVGNLERWFEWRIAKDSDTLDKWDEVRRIIIDHCFANLAKQMRNQDVRRIYFDWAWGGDRYLEGIRIHVRKQANLGDDMVAVTIVTNRSDWIRDFSGDAREFFNTITDREPGNTDYLYMTVAE